MAELTISEELHAAITDLSAAEQLSVEEYLKRTLKTVRFLQITWGLTEPKAPPAEVPVPEEEAQVAVSPGACTPWVRVGDTVLKNKVVRQLYLEFIRHVGCRVIYDAYPEDARQLIFNHQPEGKDPAFYTKIDEGRYHFWVYHTLSTRGLRKFMGTCAAALKLDMQLWDI